MFTIGSRIFGLTFRTNIRMRFNYVFFTTVAKDLPSAAATPTGVRREQV